MLLNILNSLKITYAVFIVSQDNASAMTLCSLASKMKLKLNVRHHCLQLTTLRDFHVRTMISDTWVISLISLFKQFLINLKQYYPILQSRTG
jgi:hypothetical protein